MFKFDNIGRRIKIFSRWFFWVFAIICLAAGTILLIAGAGYGDPTLAGVALIVPLVGICTAYISTMFFYGFGELVENSAICAEKSQKTIPVPQDAHASASVEQQPSSESVPSRKVAGNNSCGEDATNCNP